MTENPFKTITRLRKEGNLQGAWEFGVQELQKTPDDAYIKSAFFWVCYAILKNIMEPIKARSQKNKNAQLSNGEKDQIFYLLKEIGKLNIPPDGYNYRSLLLLFQNHLEHFPPLVLLLLRHSDNLFTHEDKQPFTTDNGESPSLMLKFARKSIACWQQYHKDLDISIDDICLLIKRTRQEVGDKKNITWLDYDKAKSLVISGKFIEARRCVQLVLKKKQTESWAWAALASTYCQDTPEVAIILFSKALCYAHEDKYALRILKNVAPILAQKGFNNEASMCIKRALNCYIENGWAVKSDLQKLLNQPWYNSNVNVEDLKIFLQKQSGAALDYLYGEREQCIAIVHHIHASGKGFHVYLDKDTLISVRLGLCRFKSIPSVGDYVRLTLATDDKSLISVENSEPSEIKDVDYAVGTLTIHEKGFGFVDNTYVPKKLILNTMDGKQVKIMRVVSFDKTKGKWSRKVLRINIIEG